jgi:hypothetical protein
MTASGPDPVSPIPDGNHSVTPWIISRDGARLIEFRNTAFGAEEFAGADASSALTSGDR